MSSESVVFDSEPESVRAARLWVAARVKPSPRIADVLICVSELVTNAVRHAQTPIEVSLDRFDDGTLHVEVRDESPEMPVPQPFSTVASTGRGLHMVDALASRWGLHRNDPGKIVWFEIDAASHP
jgi:anti-sigma regulatory factor (Ser/Thr protein kinase)